MVQFFLLGISLVLMMPGLSLQAQADEQDMIEIPYVDDQQREILLADESDGPDSGNWYEKLRGWKEAKLTYTVDIAGAMNDLESIVQEYEVKKKEIFAELDSYLMALPIKRESAIPIIDELISDLFKRQEALAQEQTRTQIRATPEESTELEEQQKMLNQLKKSFEDFSTLHQRLTQTFDEVLVNQVNNAKSFDRRALEAFNSIERTLDDKKVQEKLAVVENSLENIQAITRYFKVDLWKFIDNAWTKLHELMPAINKSIADLEEKGVVVRPLTPQEKQEMASLEKKRQELRAQKEAEREAEKARQAAPWWKKIFYLIGSIFSSLWNIIIWPFTWLWDYFQRTPVPQSPKSPTKVLKQPTQKK